MHAQVVRRAFGSGDYFEVEGTSGSEVPVVSLLPSPPAPHLQPTPTQGAMPPVSVNPATTTRVKGVYHRPRLNAGWAASRGLLDKLLVVATVVAAFVGAGLNFVDVVSDIAVVLELWGANDETLALASAAIVFGTLAVSVLMLLREGR